MSARRNSRPPEPSGDDDNSMRLQKFLASAGLGSRRKCEELITEGRVRVDGKDVVELGAQVAPDSQRVHVDGELVRADPKRYWLVNKPAGYLCTTRDPRGRPRAVDLVPAHDARLFTVGRLDENSLGLLLITNDGDLAHRLAHPRFQVERQYRVQVAGVPNRDAIKKIKHGMQFADGFFRVRGVKTVKTQGKSAFLEITLTEGQNREIRRLFARVGHKVIRLERVGFGPLRLGRLKEGECRRLKNHELKALRALLEDKSASKSNSRKSPGRPKKRTGGPSSQKPRRPAKRKRTTIE